MLNTTRIPDAIWKASELIQCLSASMRNNDYSQLWFLKARSLEEELSTIIHDIYSACHQSSNV